MVLDCFSTKIAESFKEVCGQASYKQVPQLIFDADICAKIAFISGWFNADGWQDVTGMHWSTSQLSRTLDLQLLLASIGIESSHCKIHHPEDRGIVKSKNAVEYVVNVSNVHSSVFSKTSKAREVAFSGKSKVRTFISGSYLMVPIREVERIEEGSRVYNISVDQDDSYTVQLMAVHNCKVANDMCSICGNRGPHDFYFQTRKSGRCN